MKRVLTTPLENVEALRAGDEVAISGVIYTARDAAHQRLVKLIAEGKPLPFDPKGAIIYYVGPSPAKPGEAIGSAGPTTSMRMDGLTIPLLQQGIKGMIGKGGRSSVVIEAMKEHGAVYFAAIGGAAALIAQSIKEVEAIAYPDLGAEAVHRMVVEDFPVIVAIDCQGNNLYEQGVAKYRDWRAEGAE
jgi:fumarate hydratase subunit beta